MSSGSFKHSKCNPLFFLSLIQLVFFLVKSPVLGAVVKRTRSCECGIRRIQQAAPSSRYPPYSMYILNPKLYIFTIWPHLYTHITYCTNYSIRLASTHVGSRYVPCNMVMMAIRYSIGGHRIACALFSELSVANRARPMSFLGWSGSTTTRRTLRFVAAPLSQTDMSSRQHTVFYQVPIVVPTLKCILTKVYRYCKYLKHFNNRLGSNLCFRGGPRLRHDVGRQPVPPRDRVCPGDGVTPVLRAEQDDRDTRQRHCSPQAGPTHPVHVLRECPPRVHAQPLRDQGVRRGHCCRVGTHQIQG